jgi:hypothetical protein
MYAVRQSTNAITDNIPTKLKLNASESFLATLKSHHMCNFLGFKEAASNLETASYSFIEGK